MRDRGVGDNTPRPDQRWEEHRASGEVYDPRALRETGELVPDMSPEELHARDLEARQTEGQIEDKLRDNASAALEAQADLLERVKRVDSEHVPAALRAVSDVSAKNIDGLLKVTGRDASPGEGMAQMLEAMASKGYVKLHVELGRRPPDDEDEG